MPNKALLIGINNYQWIGDLGGCLNDVTNLRDVLMKYFGFDSENISLLTDRSATKGLIKKRIKWLFDLKKGDHAVLHFSGHGSYIRDFDGDEASRTLKDDVDELICLFDMDWRNRDSFYTDDELGKITGKLPKGANLTVILDCCHSGTGTRSIVPPPHLGHGSPADPAGYGIGSTDRGFGVPGGSRGFGQPGGETGGFGVPGGFAAPPVVPRFVAPPTDIEARIDERRTRNVRRMARPRRGVTLNHVLLAGCRDDQTSADAFIGGAYNGAFTYYLCDAIREANGHITYEELMGRVRQSVRFNGYEQVPQLEGPNVDRPVFS